MSQNCTKIAQNHRVGWESLSVVLEPPRLISQCCIRHHRCPWCLNALHWLQGCCRHCHCPWCWNALHWFLRLPPSPSLFMVLNMGFNYGDCPSLLLSAVLKKGMAFFNFFATSRLEPQCALTIWRLWKIKCWKNVLGHIVAFVRHCIVLRLFKCMLLFFFFLAVTYTCCAVPCSSQMDVSTKDYFETCCNTSRVQELQ